MREGSGGRNKMFPWGDTRPLIIDDHHECTYAVGDAIFSGDCRGTVTHVSTVVARLISVVWSDSKDGAEIIYPMDATYLRKGLPWE